jgi:hypothetical protein
MQGGEGGMLTRTAETHYRLWWRQIGVSECLELLEGAKSLDGLD